MRLGIDFGTSFSLPATYHLGNKDILLPGGTYGIPSVFYYDEWEQTILIGKEAEDAGQGEEAQNLKREIKLELNSSFTTKDGTKFTATEITGYILAKVVDVAIDTARQKLIDEPLEGVVISVPAGFEHNEREFIGKAARILKTEGGPELNVLGYIKEPVAAALAYFDEPLANQTKIMVYDLGGGTCDVAVVEAKDTVDEKFVVKAADSVRVGGKDWDKRLSQYIKADIEEQTGISVEGNPTYEGKVRAAALKAKHTFSEKIGDKYKDKVQATVEINGRLLKVAITREKFNELTSDLVEQTMNLAKEQLAKKGCSDVKTIICVGGGSNMPQIKEALAMNFPDMEIKLYEPEKAIALGAAIYANNLDAEDLVDGGHGFLKDIAAFSYGYRVHRDSNSGAKICNVILGGQKLPKTIKKAYYPKFDGQKTAAVRIFESRVNEEWCETWQVPEEYILKVELPLPEGVTKGDPIDVVMTITANGILEISVDDRHGNIKKGKKEINF